MAADTHGMGRHGGGTEPTDVKLRPILVFTIGLVVAIVVVYLIVTAMFRIFATEAADRDTSAGVPLALQAPGTVEHLPPEPRIQANPAADLKTLRQKEDALLGSYSWVDERAGIVRIPIEQAMKLVLEHGLPVRQAQAAAAEAGTMASNGPPVKGERKNP